MATIKLCACANKVLAGTLNRCVLRVFHDNFDDLFISLLGALVLQKVFQTMRIACIISICYLYIQQLFWRTIHEIDPTDLTFIEMVFWKAPFQSTNRIWILSMDEPMNAATVTKTIAIKLAGDF